MLFTDWKVISLFLCRAMAAPATVQTKKRRVARFSLVDAPGNRAARRSYEARHEYGKR
jgi:hypothetical protein